MSPREFRDWVDFHRDWPFDDLHRYLRPAALMATRFGGGSLAEMLDILAPEPLPEGMSQADYNTMRAFGIEPRSHRKE